MKLKWGAGVILCAVLFGQGCSTVEGTALGVKRDYLYVRDYVQDENHWIKQFDVWLRDHLW